jgi:hypothetical protein
MKYSFVIFAACFLFCSCNVNKDRTKSEPEKKEIPKVLTDEKEKSYDRLSSSSSMDMTDAIYEELMDKNSDLKNLDESIKKNYSLMRSTLSEYHQYTSKSNEYYSSAENKVSLISDTLLAVKLRNELSSSKEKFNKLISNLNESDSTINRTYKKIQDRYIVFKIQKTLPVIENFQKEKLFDNDKMKEFIKEQNKVFELIK